MTCAKRIVKCKIETPTGKVYWGENSCENPQPSCPRHDGEDYRKCDSICMQKGHAETEALKAAGDDAIGSTATVYGHYRICDNCMKAMIDAGIVDVQIKDYHL